MTPTLVKVLQLSTAEVLEETLTEQGSENKPKPLSIILVKNRKYITHFFLQIKLMVG
jgi:hypothetical protein